LLSVPATRKRLPGEKTACGEAAWRANAAPLVSVSRMIEQIANFRSKKGFGSGHV
jgi:hypothetical protein